MEEDMSFSSWLKNRFPLKAASFQGFLDLLRREECTEVVAFATVSDSGFGAGTVTVGRIGEFVYGGVFEAKTRSGGRKILFQEDYIERFGSEGGFADYHARQLASLHGNYEVGK